MGERDPQRGDSTPTPRRWRPRAPLVPIFVLFLFVFVVLAFVTFRQLESAKAHRLRLLAGFGNRVATIIPDLADRFVRVVEERPNSIESALSNVRHLERVGFIAESDRQQQQNRAEATGDSAASALLAREDAMQPPAAPEPSLELRSTPPHLDVHYHLPSLPPDQGTVNDEESDEGEQLAGKVGQEAEPEAKPGLHVARIDLPAVLEHVLIPEVFDSVLVASAKTGQVLYQTGNPELEVANLAALLPPPQADEEASRPAHPPLRQDLVGATAIIEADLARGGSRRFWESSYKLFLQPIVLVTPPVSGPRQVTSESWVAVGLISQDRLLADSFTTSPLLLFILVVSFPAALISWPFLKLWLISPRQRITRFDVANLFLSSLLGLALLTLLVFDLLFLSRINMMVDHELDELSTSVVKNLRQELLHAHLQLTRLNRSDGSGLVAELLGREEEFGSVAGSDESVQSFLDDTKAERLAIYPYFHSVFWVRSNGQQVGKLPLHPYSVLINNVAERDYFRCALNETGSVILQFSPDEIARARRTLPQKHLSRLCTQPSPDLACLGYQATETAGRRSIDFCIEPVLSKTSAEDLAVLSVPFRGSNAEPRVAALTTRLTSLTQPLLAPGFGFAVVGEQGRAVFHSDHRRSLTENFLRASDQNRLLAKLIEDRREGGLTANYWGRRHRLRVEPLDGLPFSLVTFRDLSEIRVRNFELIYDFLLAMVPFALVLYSLAFIGIVLPVTKTGYLWPDPTRRAAYRAIVLLCFALTAILAAVLAFQKPIQLLVVSLALPLVGAVGAAAAMFRCQWLVQKSEIVDPRRPKHDRQLQPRPVVHATPGIRRLEMAVVLGSLGVGSLAFARCWDFVSGFLLVLLAIAGAFYQFRRSYFLGSQRRRAYTFALSALLFIAAVLPAVGIFQVARGRQLQFLVQETQLGLARAIEERERSLASLRGPLDLYKSYERSLATMEEANAYAIAGTVLRPSGVTGDGPPDVAADRTLWPFLDERREISRPARLLAAWISARPVPLNDLAADSGGVDLSRFGLSGAAWRSDRSQETSTRLEQEGDEDRLLARIDQRWGTGQPLLLSSAMIGGTSIGNIRWFRSLVVALALAAVAFLPGLLGRYLSDRIFLAGLSPPDRRRGLLGLLDTDVRGAAPFEWRILLVSPVPSLTAKLAGETNHYEVLRFPELVKKAKSERPADQGTEEGDDAPILVTDFELQMDDVEELEPQIRALRDLVDSGRRSIVLVSQSSYGSLLRLRNTASGRSPGQAGPLPDRVNNLLAQFVVRFGGDQRQLVGHDSWNPEDVADEFEIAMTRKYRHRLDPGYKAPPKAMVGDDPGKREQAVIAFHRMDRKRRSRHPTLKRRHELLDLLIKECSGSHQMQAIGHAAVEEVFDDSCTAERLLSHVGYLAGPYYEAIWASCSEEEKAVLVQLGWDGLVNPKNFRTVLDLMQKGLVVRRPALQLMNRSFGEFIRRAVPQTELPQWEEEMGMSAWSVLKWLLPLPLLLLGGFLFVTQQDAVSNVIGLLIAIGSLVPTFVNLYQQFQQLTSQRSRRSEA